jgi:hypothetical protein
MTKQQLLAMAGEYGRSLTGMIVGAYVIVSKGAAPWELNASQYIDVANAFWAALLPVLVRYFNPKDGVFGKSASLED